MENRTILSTEHRETFFIMLYKKAFPKVAKYISRRGGSMEDAKDIFQDSVVAYYEKAIVNQQVLKNEQAYLMGIAKHLWIKKFNSSIEQPLNDELINDLPFPDEEQMINNKLLHYLASTGEKCMRLLKAFYYDQVPVREIAGLFGYSGTRSATVQKYKCLEKVRDTVKEKSMRYEDFIE